MDVDIRFVDETRAPVVFRDWPGGEETPPPRHPREAHRLHYDHAYLANAGFSVTRSDNIGQIKQTITESTCYLQHGLAIGRRLTEFSYGGKIVPDDELMTVYEVKVTGRGELNRTDLDAFEAEVLAEVHVTLLDGREVGLVFDDFPAETITVNEVKEVVSEACEVAMSSLHMVRTYPTLRPVVFRDEQRLFGFEGVHARGIWQKPPYPGPVLPSHIPTPPQMKFEVWREADVAFLEEEEEWWHELNLQHKWQGNQERFAEEREELRVELSPPTQPEYYQVDGIGDGSGVAVHSRQIRPVDVGGKRVCTPDQSFLEGFCELHAGPGATEITSLHEPMCGDNLFLPGPSLLAKVGTDHLGYDKGVSWGTGKVSSATVGEVDVKYRLRFVDPPGSGGGSGGGGGGAKRQMKLTMVGVEAAKGPADQNGDPVYEAIEHIWEADLAKGVSGVLYIRGVYWTAPRPLSGRVLDDPRCAALKVPFCVFQKTIGDTVPDVLKSKIGLRYQNLTDRCFTVLRLADDGALEPDSVGAITESVAPLEFFGAMTTTPPRLIWANLLVAAADGEEEAWTALIIWRDPKGTISAGTAGQLAAYTCKCRCVLKASSLAEIEAEIDRVSPGGSLVRVGRPGAQTFESRFSMSFKQPPTSQTGVLTAAEPPSAPAIAEEPVSTPYRTPSAVARPPPPAVAPKPSARPTSRTSAAAAAAAPSAATVSDAGERAAEGDAVEVPGATGAITTATAAPPVELSKKEAKAKAKDDAKRAKDAAKAQKAAEKLQKQAAKQVAKSKK